MAQINRYREGLVEVLTINPEGYGEAKEIEELGRDKDELRCIFHHDKDCIDPWLEIRKEVT